MGGDAPKKNYLYSTAWSIQSSVQSYFQTGLVILLTVSIKERPYSWKAEWNILPIVTVLSSHSWDVVTNTGSSHTAHHGKVCLPSHCHVYVHFPVLPQCLQCQSLQHQWQSKRKCLAGWTLQLLRAKGKLVCIKCRWLFDTVICHGAALGPPPHCWPVTQINLNAIKLVYCCFSAPPLVRLKAAENKRFSPCHHFPYLARHSLARSRWSQIWLRERVVSAFTADGRQHHLLPLHSSALLLVPSVTSPPSAGSRGPVLHPQITWIHSLEPDLHRGTIFFLYHWAEGNSPAHKGCKHSPNSWFQASHMSLLMQLTFSCFHHFVCYTSSSFQVKNMFGTTFLCSKITFKTNNKCNFIISQSERTKYCRGKMKISFQVRG